MPQEIQQPPGRRDHDVHTALQFLFLIAVTDPAENHRRLHISEAAVFVKGGLDLRGQLPRRLQHEATAFAVGFQERQHRHRKGGGFARTGLRRPDQIFAGQDDGNGAQLNGSRLDVTCGLRAAYDFFRKSKLFERHGIYGRCVPPL